MNIFSKKQFLGAVLLSLAVLTACEKKPVVEEPKPEVKKGFQIAFANGSGSPSGTLLQGLDDLSSGEISFEGRGYELTSSRTARVFVSKDGSTLYSLNYTQGVIDKLTYHGGQNYTKIAQIDASIPLGVKAVRFTKLDDKVGSVHYISAKAVNNASTQVYEKHNMLLTIGLLDLNTMKLKEGFLKAVPLQIPDDLAKAGYYISRIDAPVVSGNKIYYGSAVSKWNATTGKADATDKTFTLVLDYPSLANPTIIQTDKVKGSSNGYRTPTQHVNEAGEILQMVSNKGETNIVKIVNGQYNPSFKFSLSELLKKKTSSNGWFYAGGGIGYIPYEDLSAPKIQIGVNPQGEPSFSSNWRLARMDFNTNTVVDLDVPDHLWLQQYQTSVVRDGKFYIALSPVGGKGNIYIFDVNSSNPKGVLGASITSGADQYYIGIY